MRQQPKAALEIVEALKLSEDQRIYLEQLAYTLLFAMPSFCREDIYLLAQRKSPTLNRNLVSKWADRWLPIMIAQNRVREVQGVYDYSVYQGFGFAKAD